MERKRRKKRLSKQGRRYLFGFLGALAIAGVVFGVVMGVHSCKVSASKRVLPFASGSNYCYTGDGFMFLNGKTLRYMNLADEKKDFSIDIESENVKLTGTEFVKALYGASTVRVIGTPFDNRIDGGIIKTASGGKYVGVYVENHDNTKSLIVYNSAGAQTYRLDFSDSMLLDFGFEGGSSSVIYTTELSTLGGAITTTITTYDLNRDSKTGVMNINGQTVKNVILTKKSVFALGTDSLVRFDRSTNEEAYRIICRGYELKSSSRDGGKLHLMLKRSDNALLPMRVLTVSESNSPEDKMTEFTSSADALDAFVMGGYVAIVHTNSLNVYSTQGKLMKSFSIDGADAVQKLDDKNILITRAGEAILYTFK